MATRKAKPVLLEPIPAPVGDNRPKKEPRRIVAPISLEEDAAPENNVPTGDQLEKVLSLVKQQMVLEKRIATGVKLLTELNEELKRLTEKDIPALFDILRVKELTLQDGVTVTVDEKVYPNITEANKDAAHKWLRAHNFGDLIKEEVKVNLGKGQETKMAQLVKWLVTKKYTDFTQKESVHPQSLGAFVREQLKKGAKLPDTIGINPVRKSTLKVIK